MSEDFNAVQAQLVAEFRDNQGKVGGMFEGWPLIVLTTTGARSGLRRSTLLGRLEIDGDLVVVASAAGAPKHPAWYHNIRHNPMVTIETGTETYQAMAAIPPGEQRDRLFDAVIERAPGFADYQAKTTRVLPVVVLHRVEEGADRVKGMGDYIVEVHDWLRQELKSLRDQIDAGTELQRAPQELAQEMRTHCLNFCSALKRHHTGEDTVAFAMLAAQFPALAPALAKLGEEHVAVQRLQEEIQRLVDGYVPGESDPAVVRDELDRLGAELEAHYEYEERTVVTALNALAEAPTLG
jgi:deazaflavin-dependent oxidoreductase (nitroreductase family)